MLSVLVPGKLVKDVQDLSRLADAKKAIAALGNLQYRVNGDGWKNIEDLHHYAGTASRWHKAPPAGGFVRMMELQEKGYPDVYP